MPYLVPCPNCGGKGVWRREWNERIRDYWMGCSGYCRAKMVNRFRDEVCPRCEGRGEVLKSPGWQDKTP